MAWLKTHIQGRQGGPAPLVWRVSQLPGARAFPKRVFFSNGEGVPALSLGNRQGPMGSQPGVKADGDKIKQYLSFQHRKCFSILLFLLVSKKRQVAETSCWKCMNKSLSSPPKQTFSFAHVPPGSLRAL